MQITRTSWKSKNGKVYESVWLRQSYREGKKTGKRAIANLKGCTPEEIAAIELALKHKGDLSALTSVENVKLKEGLSVGAVWTVYEVARRLGIEKALGDDRAGQLALWQVLARVMDQGSRLSAVRLARVHAACDVLRLQRGFNENDLYENLTWLCGQQARIEKSLFKARRGTVKPDLFLYDVTSSYLEGEHNALGAYGYNRDRKKGKMQIVIGLLCDGTGEPVSVEVFSGNTQDTQTFGAQVEKVAKRFGCEHVTMVGDRGMIKRTQIEALPEHFHYITAITKPQIETLLKANVFQLELFDEALCEVEHEEVRYILRCNPVRRQEIALTRQSKRRNVEKRVEEQNRYLSEHGRAHEATAVNKVRGKIEQLGLDGWLSVTISDRVLALSVDEQRLTERSRLDGCYVLKTDVPPAVADKTLVHQRYKDLADVEQAFRTSKTVHLEMRPVFVHNEANTRGHVFVVMLAYLIRRALSRAWAPLDTTVEEGLDQLKTLCSINVKFPEAGACLQIPEPRDDSMALLRALDIHLPKVLPHSHACVVTHKKLNDHRKLANG
jgi:transposase